MDRDFENLKIYRPFIQRVYFVYVLLDLAYRWYSNVLLHQLAQPVLFDPEFDLTYYGFVVSGLSFQLTQHYWLAVLFDGLLFIAALAGLLFASRNIFPTAFFICYFIYIITFNLFSGHHYHTIGILVMGFPFIFSDGISFSYMFYAVRYFLLFEMGSASLWKLFRGTLVNVDQFTSILKFQRIDYALFYPDAFKSQLTAFFIDHTYVAHSMWVGLFILQFSFIAGFFTRKLDLMLLCAYVFFSVGSYLLMHMFTLVLENSVLLLTLLPWKKLSEKSGLFPH